MIKIRSLRKDYGNVTVLKDISADIHAGDVIALIGPSGTGKSTLLRCMNLLETADSGSILLDGTEILAPHCDIRHVRQTMGMVFQNFNLFGHLTAIENIMIPQMDLLNRSKQEAYERGTEILRRVGLHGVEFKYPHQLSGGQKQRVAIARTLAMNPEVILFDEPTSALDPAMAAEVQSVMRDLRRQGKTMLIVTHDMRFARSISTRVFFMTDGVIFEEGTPQDIFEHPRREQTRRFIHNLKVLEIHIDDMDSDFPGAYTAIRNFCINNQVSSSVELRINQVFEELLQQILLLECGAHDIQFSAECSESGESTEITAAYHGKPFDLDRIENQLALSLLRNAADEITTAETDGAARPNQIRLTLR